MTQRAAFAYAHVRMQARRAAAPTGQDWQLAADSRDFGHCLDLLGRSALGPAVRHIPRDANPDRIEAVLREEWRLLVAEVARWVPASVRPAVTWIALLPHLRVLQSGDVTGGLASLWPREGDDPADVWRAGFVARLGAEAAAIETALPGLFTRYLGSTAGEAASVAADLDAAFRRQPQSLIATVAFLGLCALDFERARGALSATALFAAASEAA